MQNSAKIKRYFRIIELVQNHPKPTPKLLNERLEEDGFFQSRRTIERALKEIRNEFFIDINYDRKKRQYIISDEEESYTQQLIGFFKLNYQAETLVSELGGSKKLSTNVVYEFDQRISGAQHLSPLLEAIKTKKEVSINHQKFEASESKKRTIAPYLIKEFNGRWYVLGEVLDKSKNLRVFAIDRITNIEITKNKFKPTIKNPKKYFKDIIGVSGWENKLEKIIIEFSSDQGKYVKSLPLHESQVIISDDENKLIIQLEIKPSYEFYQLLWKQGSSAKVLSPKHIVDRVKLELNNTLKRYE